MFQRQKLCVMTGETYLSYHWKRLLSRREKNIYQGCTKLLLCFMMENDGNGAQFHAGDGKVDYEWVFLCCLSFVIRITNWMGNLMFVFERKIIFKASLHEVFFLHLVRVCFQKLPTVPENKVWFLKVWELMENVAPAMKKNIGKRSYS